MLVLSRYEGESIIVGGDIRIQVLSIRGGRVNLGITAPAQFFVDREDIAWLRRHKASAQRQKRRLH
jgi:carbon storage regulator